MRDDDVPRGCECPDCGSMSRCTGANAPVAYTVERDGEQLDVCTRCDLSTDNRIAIIPHTDDLLKPYMDYDALGAIVLADEIDHTKGGSS